MLDAGGGGGGVAKMMGGIVAAANDGSFAVNETGGTALLQAIREMAKWVDENLADLATLAQQPALGTSNGASTMKPYVQSVAVDKQGFLTMLREFRTSLTAAEQGVTGAMKNYREIDTGNAANYRPV